MTDATSHQKESPPTIDHILDLYTRDSLNLSSQCHGFIVTPVFQTHKGMTDPITIVLDTRALFSNSLG